MKTGVSIESRLSALEEDMRATKGLAEKATNDVAQLVRHVAEVRRSNKRLERRIDEVDLKLSKKIDSTAKELRQEVQDTASVLRGEMRGMADTLRGEMREMADALRGEMREMVDALRGEMHEMAGTLRGEMRAMGGSLVSEIRHLGRSLEQHIVSSDARFERTLEIIAERDRRTNERLEREILERASKAVVVESRLDALESKEDTAISDPQIPQQPGA